MLTFEGLDENFRFIVIEVENQVRATRKFLDAPSRELFNRIISRDDYIDNLKTIIENKCFSKIHTEKDLSERLLNKIRAIQIIGVNLERIADYFSNIVRQMGYLDDQAFILRYGREEIFDIILDGLGNILTALNKEDMSKALSICKAENELDRLYKICLDRVLNEMVSGGHTQNLITVLFIFRYFERAGDSLLNIGEAVIFSILGERIKIEQFDALQQTLSKSGFSSSLDGIDFKSIWGTRSGCRIGRLGACERKDPDAIETQGSIYKEGGLAKIRKERDSILRWQSVFPGLVAGIYGFHEEGDKASMLVEFLPGCTLDEVLLTSDEEFFKNAFFILEQTVKDAWITTMRPGPIKIDFIAQLQARLESVLQVHPEFWRMPKTMGSSTIRSMEELLSACSALEQELAAPFSVLIHGDFNINNVVYRHETQQIHYVDLYRSGDFDYLQDVSVFLVSMLRLPVFDPDLRSRINTGISQFFAFAREFASEMKDDLFQARLGFALARSFYTSTRFELNFRFAGEMYKRAVFLLEKIYHFKGKDWREFFLPEDILFL